MKSIKTLSALLAIIIVVDSSFTQEKAKPLSADAWFEFVGGSADPLQQESYIYLGTEPTDCEDEAELCAVLATVDPSTLVNGQPTSNSKPLELHTSGSISLEDIDDAHGFDGPITGTFETRFKE